MSAFVHFPDAEIALLDYLRAVVPGIVCDVEVPESYRGDEGIFVCVRRAGGQPRYPVADYPMYDIQVYAPTRDVGADGLGYVLAQIAVARYAPPVSGVFGRISVISGPQYVPDPVTDEHRWQALISIPLRGKRA